MIWQNVSKPDQGKWLGIVEKNSSMKTFPTTVAFFKLDQHFPAAKNVGM